MSKAYLKIKIKSLAAEAVIIRHDENKHKYESKKRWIFGESCDEEKALEQVLTRACNPSSVSTQVIRDDLHKLRISSTYHRELWLGLQFHRRFVVRPEQRAANLAYAYLRGRKYERTESICYDEPEWGRVAELVLKYGPRVELKTPYVPAKDTTLSQQEAQRRYAIKMQVTEDLITWRGAFHFNNKCARVNTGIPVDKQLPHKATQAAE